MPEILLPTKAVQDSIKVDTTDIKNILNAGIGTDWSKYSPFQDNNSTQTPAGSAYTTVLEVVGGGYLTKALVTQDGNVLTTMQITIDGKIIYKTSNNVSTSVSGLLPNDELLLNSAKLSTFAKGASLYTVDISDAFDTIVRNGKSVLLNQPIFFKETLKVEISTASSAIIHWVISGGIE